MALFLNKISKPRPDPMSGGAIFLQGNHRIRARNVHDQFQFSRINNICENTQYLLKLRCVLSLVMPELIQINCVTFKSFAIFSRRRTVGVLFCVFHVVLDAFNNKSVSKKDCEMDGCKVVENVSSILLTDTKKATEILKGIVHAAASNRPTEDLPSETSDLRGDIVEIHVDLLFQFDRSCNRLHQGIGFF